MIDAGPEKVHFRVQFSRYRADGTPIGRYKSLYIVTFKDVEQKVFARAVEVIKENYRKEEDLDREVQKMLDDLERSNGGEFQRYKMYPILKQKLAKERKIIL